MPADPAGKRIVGNAAAAQHGQHRLGARAAHENVHTELHRRAGRSHLAGLVQADDFQIDPGTARADVPGQLAQLWQGQAYVLEAHMAHARSEEHTSELQSPCNLVCRLLLEKKKKKKERSRDILIYSSQSINS